MLMEEAPPMSKLAPLDLGGEAEAHFPLDQTPTDLINGHLLKVDVLVEGAPVAAVRATHDQEGLVLRMEH